MCLVLHSPCMVWLVDGGNLLHKKAKLAVRAWFHTVPAWCGWWMGVTYCTRRQSGLTIFFVSYLPAQTVMGYTIPPGHQVCVSPTVNHQLPDIWNDHGKFRPDR